MGNHGQSKFSQMLKESKCSGGSDSEFVMRKKKRKKSVDSSATQSMKKSKKRSKAPVQITYPESGSSSSAVRNGAEVRAKHNITRKVNREPPLITAIENLNAPKLRRALRCYNSTRSLNEGLKEACKNGCLEATRLLIEVNASPNYRCKENYPVWQWALDIEGTAGNFRCAFNCKKAHRMTPHPPPEGVICDYCKKPIRVKEPFFYHCGVCYEDKCLDCVWKFKTFENRDGTQMNQVTREIMLGYLICAKADIDAQDSDGNTALMWAVNRNLTETIWMLLTHKADPTIANSYNQRPCDQKYNLIQAEDIRALVFCCTSLRYHIQNEHKKAQRLATFAMLEFIGSPGRDGKRCLALIWPHECGQILLQILRLNKGEKFLALLHFSKVYWNRAATKLARKKSRGSQRMFYESQAKTVPSTPLHIAAQMGDLKDVRYLLDMGAPVDILDPKDVNKSKLTPLHLSCGGQSVWNIDVKDAEAYSTKNLTKRHGSRNLLFKFLNSITRLLLDSKADMLAQDRNKNTPLHWAVKKGRLSVVELFLREDREKFQAACNMTNIHGNLPVHYASYHGHLSNKRLKILKILLEWTSKDCANSRNDFASDLVCHGNTITARAVRQAMRQTKAFNSGIPTEEYILSYSALEPYTLSPTENGKALEKCSLCPYYIRPGNNRMVYTHGKKVMQFHPACVVWTPEVSFELTGRLRGMNKMLCRMSKGRLACAVCKKARAMIACHAEQNHGQSMRTFHIPCAILSGCRLVHGLFHHWHAVLCERHTMSRSLKDHVEHYQDSSEDDEDAIGLFNDMYPLSDSSRARILGQSTSTSSKSKLEDDNKPASKEDILAESSCLETKKREICIDCVGSLDALKKRIPSVKEEKLKDSDIEKIKYAFEKDEKWDAIDEKWKHSARTVSFEELLQNTKAPTMKDLKIYVKKKYGIKCAGKERKMRRLKRLFLSTLLNEYFKESRTVKQEKIPKESPHLRSPGNERDNPILIESDTELLVELIEDQSEEDDTNKDPDYNPDEDGNGSANINKVCARPIRRRVLERSPRRVSSTAVSPESLIDLLPTGENLEPSGKDAFKEGCEEIVRWHTKHINSMIGDSKDEDCSPKAKTLSDCVIDLTDDFGTILPEPVLRVSRGRDTMRLQPKLKKKSWLVRTSGKKNIIMEDLSLGLEAIKIPVVNNVDSETIPGNFTYIKTRKRHPSFEKRKIRKGCSCKKRCWDDKHCACLRAYDKKIFVSFGKDKILRKLYQYDDITLFECHEGCSCPASCKNRLTRGGIRHKIEVFRTRYKGWALRTLETIEQGSFVMEYVGELLPPQLADSRSFTYLWSLTENAVLDPSAKGNAARFMNSSCTPNLQGIKSCDCGDKEGLSTRIVFFANQRILKGQELTISYGYSLSKDPGICLPCRCHSPACRHLMT